VVEAIGGTPDNSAAATSPALPVQRDQRVTTQQLGLRQTDHELTGADTAGTLLDRPHPTIEHGDHPDLVEELRERRDPGGCGQRRVRRADAHTLPTTRTTAYSLHRQGASPAWILDVSTTSILQAGQAPSSPHTPLTAPLPADPGQTGRSVPVGYGVALAVRIVRSRISSGHFLPTAMPPFSEMRAPSTRAGDNALDNTRETFHRLA